MPQATSGPIRFWRRHFLGVEGALALVLPTAFAIWAEWTRNYNILGEILKDNRGSVYGTLASVFGALLGFVITTLSLVAGFASRLSVLRASPYYDQLWNVFTSATWSLGVATVVPVVALLFDRNSHPCRWLVYVVMWTTLLGVDRVFRCVWVLEKVVMFVAHEPLEPQPPATPPARKATDRSEEDS